MCACNQYSCMEGGNLSRWIFKKKPSIILDYSSLCFVWEINKGAAIRILLFLLYERKVESKITVKEFFQYYTTFGSEENCI